LALLIFSALLFLVSIQEQGLDLPSFFPLLGKMLLSNTGSSVYLMPAKEENKKNGIFQYGKTFYLSLKSGREKMPIPVIMLSMEKAIP